MSDHDPNPGERHRTGPPRLDRVPGERYAARANGPALATRSGTAAAGRAPRSLLAAALAAAAGALLFCALGTLDLGPGLIAAAAGIGWAVALALLWSPGGAESGSRRRRVTVAGGLGAAAILVGLMLNWAWSRAVGGVLDPIAYLDQRYGPLALLDVAVAAIAGAARAR
jgi:hypothetical protein